MQSGRLALLISADSNHRRWMAPVAYRCGLYLICSSDLREGSERLRSNRFALAFCSDQTCGGSVRSALQSLRASAPDVPVIVLSRQAEWGACLNAMSGGAFDYMAWPLDTVEADRVVRLALAQPVAVARPVAKPHVRRLHSAA